MAAATGPKLDAAEAAAALEVTRPDEPSPSFSNMRVCGLCWPVGSEHGGGLLEERRRCTCVTIVCCFCKLRVMCSSGGAQRRTPEPTRRTRHAVPSPQPQVYGLQEEDWNQSALSIVVVGASGDLAKKKIFPALFALYYENMLPKVGCGLGWGGGGAGEGVETLPSTRSSRLCACNRHSKLAGMRATAAAPSSLWVQNFSVYGYARSKMTDEEFRDFIASNLTCRLSES